MSYILEGSGQKYGNQVRLTLQLIDAVNDQHVWSSPYVRVIEIESIFTLQSEIAQLVAAEIEAIITPEEKQRIEKIPTNSQTAYDLYQKAGIFFNRYSASMTNHDAFKEAVDLYHYAIEYDSTFAEAYLNLGIIYFHRYRLDNSRYKDYLDSAVIYSNIALGYDPELAGAYSLRGALLNLQGKTDQGITALNKALEYNPNSADAHNELGWLYMNRADYVNSINSFYKSTFLDMSRDDLERGYFSLGFALTHSGFIDHAKYYLQEALKQNGDSIGYYWYLAYAEHLFGNFEKSIEISKKALQKAPDYLGFLMIMGRSYIFLDDYKESYVVFDRLDYLMDSLGVGDTWFKPWMSFAFMKNDQKERAIDMANQQIIQGEEWISTRRSGFEDQYSLNALAYAIKEDTDSVLFNLNMYNQREAMEIQVVTFRDDPIFDNLKVHPEFKRIYKELEAKYFVEHERVRQWLEENHMLKVSSLSH